MVRFSQGTLGLDWVGLWIRAFQKRERLGQSSVVLMDQQFGQGSVRITDP